MRLIAKDFSQLSKEELYEILKARQEVFVVEQARAYQDLDELDYESFHVFYEEDDRVLAYLRAFLKEGEPGTIQMSRVLTVERGNGIGGKLLKDGIAAIVEEKHPERIYLEAKNFAVGFYEREGFQVISDEFEVDGQAHVAMVLEIDQEN